MTMAHLTYVAGDIVVETGKHHAALGEPLGVGLTFPHDHTSHRFWNGRPQLPPRRLGVRLTGRTRRGAECMEDKVRVDRDLLDESLADGACGGVMSGRINQQWMPEG